MTPPGMFIAPRVGLRAYVRTAAPGASNDVRAAAAASFAPSCVLLWAPMNVCGGNRV